MVLEILKNIYKMKKTLLIKKKLVNHLLMHGKKTTSEKTFLKSFKSLQKDSKKQTKNLIKIALLQSTPIFKLHKLSQKKRKKKNVKEIPAFIKNTRIRTSLAIKEIYASLKKKKNISELIKKEILLLSQNKGESSQLKNKSQEYILTKKHLLKFYRWN